MRLTKQERAKANMLAAMIDCSPHEWPKDQHEIQLLCHGYLDRVVDNQALRDRIAQLEAELAAAKGDAERYRWARTHPVKLEDLLEKFWGNPEAFDAAIDAARGPQ
jgi:hypothetical protein